MAGAFARLCIGLQAEAQTLQQSTNQLLARAEAQVGQRRGQVALALAHPQQGSFRIADCTKSFKVSRRPGCVSAAGLPPPPCLRTRRLNITAPERRSAR